MINKEWFKHWFDSPEYYLLYSNRNDEEAQDFMDILMEYLKPHPMAKMLDVACGKGRHAKCLSEKGFDVTGFDLSNMAIDAAKEMETENLQFFVHDMRYTFWINYFDFAFNFFTSIGYFNTLREENDAVRTIAQSLNSKGICVIDYLNVKYVQNNFVPLEEKEMGNTKFHIERREDENHFYKKIQIADENGVLEEAVTEKVTKFSKDDFAKMFAAQNMELQEVFGDYKLGKYDVENSPRMILIFKKIS